LLWQFIMCNQHDYGHGNYFILIKTTQVKATISRDPQVWKVGLRGMNAPHAEVAQEAKHRQGSPMGGIAGTGPDRLTNQRWWKYVSTMCFGICFFTLAIFSWSKIQFLSRESGCKNNVNADTCHCYVCILILDSGWSWWCVRDGCHWQRHQRLHHWFHGQRDRWSPAENILCSAAAAWICMVIDGCSSHQ
jgi:hypothetical protein